MAQLDVMRAYRNTEKALTEHDIPWLALLEERARSDDLPGILGQVHIDLNPQAPTIP